MAKPILTTTALVLGCLFALSFALPPAFNQIMAARTIGPSVPRTLLGKPYRMRLDLQECTPPHESLAAIDCNNSDADCASAQHVVAGGNDGFTRTALDTAPHVQLPLPLVLNTPPESILARPRRMKLERPWWNGPYSDEAPLSNQARARSDGMVPKVEDMQRVQVVVRPDEQAKSRDTSTQVGRLKRLYDRGEWKSRLFEEY